MASAQTGSDTNDDDSTRHPKVVAGLKSNGSRRSKLASTGTVMSIVERSHLVLKSEFCAELHGAWIVGLGKLTEVCSTECPGRESKWIEKVRFVENVERLGTNRNYVAFGQDEATLDGHIEVGVSRSNESVAPFVAELSGCVCTPDCVRGVEPLRNRLGAIVWVSREVWAIGAIDRARVVGGHRDGKGAASIELIDTGKLPATGDYGGKTMGEVRFV